MGLKVYRRVRLTGPPLAYDQSVRHDTSEPTLIGSSSEVTNMNPHKIRVIEAFIRSQGGLPSDQFGKILGPDELLVWFGLNQVLSPTAVQNNLGIVDCPAFRG